MTGQPEHQQAALRELIARGLPAEQIAFMMNTSLDLVEAEIARMRQSVSVTTTKDTSKDTPSEEDTPSR